MLKIQLKKLIYDLENILKNDKRFKKNRDNNFKKIIKTMHINSIKQPIINVSNITTPITNKTECLKPIIKVMNEICNCKPCASVKTTKIQSYENCYELVKEDLEQIRDDVNRLSKI
jgi:hypothetical protein